MENSLPKERASGASNSEFTRKVLLVIAFFFAVSSLVPTAYGRVFLIWPALSPIGAVIGVFSTWMILRALVMKGELVVRCTAAVALLMMLPFWIDVISLVTGDGRSLWQMMADGWRMWVG